MQTKERKEIKKTVSPKARQFSSWSIYEELLGQLK